MRNDRKKIKRARKTGKLYGIGIGPGDPKLLTLKAKEILEKADVIFVPKAYDDSGSFARSIVEAAVKGHKKYIEITFPMIKDKDKLRSHWRGAAYRVAEELREGKNAAFVTIGDPFIYSTYIYLLKIMNSDFPDIEVETVPGVTSFNAAASRAGLPLVERNERMAVVPVTEDVEKLRGVLRDFDAVVLMKVGSKLEKVKALLKETGLIKKSVLVSRVGCKDEKIVKDVESLKDEKAGYLSVIIVKKGHLVIPAKVGI